MPQGFVPTVIVPVIEEEVVDQMPTVPLPSFTT
jgi:hypothetical protein